MNDHSKSFSREFAFCFLYSHELVPENFDSEEKIQNSLQGFQESIITGSSTSLVSTFKNEQALSQTVLKQMNQSFAHLLIKNYFKDFSLHIDKLQTQLDHSANKLTDDESTLENKKLSKMNKIDKVLSLLALTENSNSPETPRLVIISEYNKLAHKYGSDGSVKLINAVLDKLL